MSGLEWGSNLHTHISDLLLYQLSYQALGSKLVGRKGIQVLALGAHYIRKNFLLWNTPGSDDAVSQLDALAIRPNSSVIHFCSTCIQVPRYSFWEKKSPTQVLRFSVYVDYNSVNYASFYIASPIP